MSGKSGSDSSDDAPPNAFTSDRAGDLSWADKRERALREAGLWDEWGDYGEEAESDGGDRDD